MTEFKSGDKVLCVNTEELPSKYTTGGFKLEKNIIYTLDIVKLGVIILKGQPFGWRADRFIDAEKYLHSKDFEKRVDNIIEND